MATPLQLPAMPTASPVKIGVEPRQSPTPPSLSLLVERFRKHLDAGRRHFVLTVPESLHLKEVALSCALEKGGAALVITTNPRRRSAWRDLFSGLEGSERDGETTSATCITHTQLTELLNAANPSPVLDQAPLWGLSTLLLDTPHLPKCSRDAIDRLLKRNRDFEPLLIELNPLGFRSLAVTEEARSEPPRVPALAFAPCDSVPLTLDPALLAQEGECAPHQTLFRVVALRRPPPTLALQEIEAHLQALRLDSDNPSLATFVRALLPHHHFARGSRRDRTIEALSNAWRETIALLRVNRALGNELPRSIAVTFGRALELERTPSLREWRSVLRCYRAHLESLGLEALSPESDTTSWQARRVRGIEQRIDDVLRQYQAPDDWSDEHVAQLNDILALERATSPAPRAVLVLDDFGFESASLALEARLGQLGTAVARVGLSVSPGRPGAPVEIWPHALLGVVPARHFTDVDVLIDLRLSTSVLALSCDVLNLLRGSRRAVNLWRVVALDGHQASTRSTLSRIVRAEEQAFALSAEGRAIPTVCPLRPLLEHNASRSALSALERQTRSRAKRRLELEGGARSESRGNPITSAGLPAGTPRGNSVPGRNRLDPSYVAIEELPETLSSEHSPHGLSPRRLQKRHLDYVADKRQTAIEVVLAILFASIILPSFAGPVLGTVIALLVNIRLLMLSRKRINQSRRRSFSSSAGKLANVVDVAAVVLRTMRSCEGIDKYELPSSLIHSVEFNDGRVHVWLAVDDPRLCRLFVTVLAEALGPIIDHRYIIGRSSPSQPRPGPGLKVEPIHVAHYHPVPKAFSVKREVAELYAGYWSQVFGPCRLRYTADGKGRLLKFAHFGRLHFGVRSRARLAV